MKLQEERPDVDQTYQDGLHVVRRMDRYWAGLSADLVIEQVLMRSLKTTGSLAGGRGMSEAQCSVCLFSRTICFWREHCSPTVRLGAVWDKWTAQWSLDVSTNEGLQQHEITSVIPCCKKSIQRQTWLVQHWKWGRSLERSERWSREGNLRDDR